MDTPYTNTVVYVKRDSMPLTGVHRTTRPRLPSVSGRQVLARCRATDLPALASAAATRVLIDDGCRLLAWSPAALVARKQSRHGDVLNEATVQESCRQEVDRHDSPVPARREDIRLQRQPERQAAHPVGCAGRRLSSDEQAPLGCADLLAHP